MKRSIKEILSGILIAVLIMQMAAIIPLIPADKFSKENVLIAVLDTEVTVESAKPIIAVLNKATSKDTVIILINSPGGSVGAGGEIIDAMKASKAKNIIAYVPSYAASMATLIATEADALYVTPVSIILIHTISDEQGKIGPFYGQKVHEGYSEEEWTDIQTFSKIVFAEEVNSSMGLYSTEAFLEVAANKDVISTPLPLFYLKILLENNGTSLDEFVSDDWVFSGIDNNDLSNGMLFNKLIKGVFHPTILVLPRGV